MLMFAHGFYDPLRDDRAARGRGRHDDRAEGARSPGAPHVRAGDRHAGARRRAPGRHRQGPGARAGVRAPASAPRAPACIETTFKEETETDLFGEQSVLCGGASS